MIRKLIISDGNRTHTSLKKFATAARLVAHVSLQHKGIPQDLSWLCNQSTGKFLVACGVHVVGVDCASKFVYDCGQMKALFLSPLSLRRMSIIQDSTLEIRLISS
jgi:hypothetical protein